MESLESWLGKPRPPVNPDLEDYYDYLTFRDTVEDEDHDYQEINKEIDQLFAEIETLASLPKDHPLFAMTKKLEEEKGIPLSENVITVGGISMKHPALVCGTGQERFADLPVSVLAVDRKSTSESVLMMPPPLQVLSQTVTDIVSTHFPAQLHPTPPVFVVAAETPSDMKLTGAPVPASSVEKALTSTQATDVITSTLSSYVLNADVEDLFQIPGLAGKLYKFQGDDDAAPVKEHVRLKRGDEQDGLLGQILPFMDVKSFGKAPISNLEFVYSEDDTDMNYATGLRVEADVEFKDSLQPVADALANLFSRSNANNKSPTSLRLSAHLAKNREDRWKKFPKIKIFTLKGYVNMEVWAGSNFQFTRVGVELKFKKLTKSGGTGKESDDAEESEKDASDGGGPEEDGDSTEVTPKETPEESSEADAAEAEDEGEVLDVKDKKNLTVGLAFYGELNIHNLPGSLLPLRTEYRMSKLGSDYELKAKTDEWKSAFGYEKFTISSIEFSTTFSTSKTGDSLKVKMEAKTKLGAATIDLIGEYSRDETFLEGEAKDLTWNEIVATYEQIMGRKVHADTKGNDLEFKNLKLRLGTKGFSFHGEASFNGKSSAEATISFDSEGLAIEGKLEDYKIEGTEVEIKEASLDIFVGKRGKGNKRKDLDQSEKGIEEASELADLEPAAANEKALALLGVEKTESTPKSQGPESSEETIEDPENQDDTTSKKKAIKFKGRSSRFGIKGIVKFAGVTVTAGLQVSNTEEKGRQWIVYGAYGGDIVMSDLAPELRGTWLDVVLRNPAVIASSQQLEEENDLVKLKYPISKGIQLCATIDSLDQISKLSGPDEEEVRGIRLIACMKSLTKLEITLYLPPDFVVNISEAARIGDFNVGVEISRTPGLNFGGNLRLSLKSQETPLIFQMNLRADITGMSGSIATETVWKNPFGISDAVEISELRGEVGFMYATVFLTGPSKLGLAANGRAGKIRAGAAFAVSQRPDEQVFSLELSKLSIGSIIQFVGDAYQIHELREFGKEDFLVFTDAKMYFSTGGTIARKEYPAGISASGQMTLFGKTAAFEASATTDGLKFLGTLDEFQIGPLIVTSASGAKQAKLELEVTRDRQYFEIDGMIKFYDIQLKALVKAGLKPFELEALISIHLGDVLKFDLEARLKNIDKGDLKNADVYLRCEFDADILGKFLDAIEDFLDSIQKLTDESIDSMEIKLLQMKHEVEGKRLATQTKLITARREVQERREARNTIYTQEQKRLKAAREELQRLERLVRDAKDKEAAAVKQAEQQLFQARRKCNILKEQKRKEYAVELQRVENEKRKYESEKRDLENKKRIKFGDAIKSLEYAESRVATLADNLKMHNGRVAMFERLVRESGHFRKAFKWVELQGEIVARDAVLTAKMVAEGILREVKNVVRGAEIIGIEKALNVYANKVNQVASSLEALVTKGPDAFAMALVYDEEEKIRLRAVELNKLLAHNSVYGQAIRDAQRRLDENSPHLEEEIAAADKKIADARDDKRLKDLEARLASLLDEERLLNEKIRNIVQILEGIRTGVREVTATMKGIIQGVKNVTIRITKVKVEVDAQDLRNGGKLKFEVHAMVFGRAKSVKVNWSPKQTAQELFTDVTKQMIGV